MVSIARVGRLFLALLLLLPATALAKPSSSRGAPPSCGALRCWRHADAAQALRQVLALDPRVLGIGELHQTRSTRRARSALSRFTQQLLPVLAGRASDLIAETWVAEGGGCEAETQAVEEIAEQTERPPETEDELVTMLLRARALGVEPHVLELSCADYRGLLDDAQELDLEKTLLLVTRLLAAKVTELAAPNGLLVVYGGAAHNDLSPPADLAELSYARRLGPKIRSGYVSLDLVVPELVDRQLQGQEPWYPLLRQARADQSLLVETSSRAYVLILPKGARQPSPPATR